MQGSDIDRINNALDAADIKPFADSSLGHPVNMAQRRECLRLRRKFKLTFDQIGERLGVSGRAASAMYSRIMRG